MLTTRAMMTHFSPFFFFPPHVHAGTRACLIFEGEGVGTTDRRVWHMRTFPGATDMRPTHSPTLCKWTSGYDHFAVALVLGTSLRKIMNMSVQSVKMFIKNILNIMALPTKNLK